MAYPTKYTRQYDYSSYQNSNPNRPLPADKVNADLNAQASSSDSIVEFLKTSLRADGAVANGAISYEQLSTELQSAGLAPIGLWTLGVSYGTSQVVVHGTGIYQATVAHVAADFTADLSAGKWKLLATLPVAAGYGGSSTASLLIENSTTKVFPTQSGLAYQVGNYTRASSAANGANFMEGLVSAYAGTSLSIAVTKIGGAGTFADWNFAVSGAPGLGDVVSTNNLSDLPAKYTAKDNISVHGADVASASTVNLETATGDLVDVTGTTTITAITLGEGHERTVRFTGILTLTNGASLIIPGGNLTTAAGDLAVFRGYAAGVVRCTSYTKITGKPITPNTAAEVGAAASVFGRTGAVVAVSGDYTYSANTLPYPARFWQGYQHSNNVSTPNTKIDVAAGSCRDSTDALNIVNSAGTIDFGTVGANGLDAGALPAPIACTISNASPAVFTKTAHGLTAGTEIGLTSSGTLNTGLSLGPVGATVGTRYFVIAAGLTANAFEVSDTLGGAAINTSSAGSGTQSYTVLNNYYTHAICKAAGATPGFLASLSPTVPTLPTTYTNSRRIGMVRNDSAGNLLAFTHINNRWTWAVSPRDYNAIPTRDTTTLTQLSVPKVLGVVARFAATAFCSPSVATASTAYVYPGFMTTAARTGFAVGSWANTNGIAQASSVQVNSSGQVNIETHSAGTDPIKIVLDVAGWDDDL